MRRKSSATHPFIVLLGLHGYGLSPEEEALHARFWLTLLIMVGLLMFALGYSLGCQR
jgi:hypothetical protein